MHVRRRRGQYCLCGLAAVLLVVPTVVIGCGGGAVASSSTTTTSTTITNPYAVAYESVAWGTTVKVSFPSSCEITITTTGQPDYTPNAWYLAPASGTDTVVAHTAVSNTPLALISYATMIKPSLEGATVTLNDCPTKASATTAANLGAIGYLISGTAMFNPFEMNGTTPAVADNGSYTFTDSNNVQQTAYFIDQCNSHSNGTTWHAHGNPSCVTSQVDTSTGPSHIIGIALDGFPIYGGRDINGNVIGVSQLDACNGITSATPEFPSGAYHYVLPIGVTTKYASINCYSGTASSGTMAAARKQACNMKMMFAMLKEKQQNGKKKDTTMVMPDGTVMRAGAM
ncbi:MAG: YHYH protein [Terracidiphilus sp.]